MKFPILILDSLETRFNSESFTRFSGLEFKSCKLSTLDSKESCQTAVLIKDLNNFILYRAKQESCLEILKIIKENSRLILLLHTDLIEISKLQIIEFLKDKVGTILEYNQQKMILLQKTRHNQKKIYQIKENGSLSQILKSQKSINFAKTVVKKDVDAPKSSQNLENTPMPTSTMNLSRSENAATARDELVLPHTKVISQKESAGLIYYSHDLLDALDDEDDDLDF